jgi:riboflavin kinase/FMN adenylyltransferase
MIEVFGFNQLRKVFPKTVLAIGVFDGVHAGHQQLIKRAVNEARKIGGTAMVMTFFPHPVQVLKPELQLPMLVSLKYRLKLIAQLGVDVCLVVKFSKTFSQLNPMAFIENILLKKINPHEVFIGYDFRFGKDREGSLNLLQSIAREKGFRVNIVHAIKRRQKPISSTLIRNLIVEGNLSRAGSLLGRRVSLLGTVRRGDARGKSLGFPTANIDPNCEVIPPAGVYAVRIEIGQYSYRGMANIGRRPSFKRKNSPLNIEVHIFNFKKNIYGQDIIVEFVKKLRDEKMFNSKEALIQQLKNDELRAKRVIP